MAYTTKITKKSVTRRGNGIYNVVLNMTVTDDVKGEVFNKDFVVPYNTNEPDFKGFESRYAKKMKKAWDNFLAEQEIMKKSDLDSSIAKLQTIADAYCGS